MRTAPALVTQRQFRKAHGDELAKDLDLNKIGYPIINHRHGEYWILDGQHRVYALRQNGFDNELLDCEVYEDLTDPQAADIFLGRDARRAVNMFDKFHIACTAGYERECSIRRCVETQRLKISQSQGEGCVAAIAALGKVYDRAGEIVLGQVLRSIRDAYGGDGKSFDGFVIEALGLVFNRYTDRLHEGDLATRLSRTPNGQRGLIQRAEGQRIRTGNLKVQCIAAAAVEIYNKGAESRTGRLPAWWKEEEDEAAAGATPAPVAKKVAARRRVAANNRPTEAHP